LRGFKKPKNRIITPFYRQKIKKYYKIVKKRLTKILICCRMGMLKRQKAVNHSLNPD